MPTFTALTTLTGQKGAEALGEAMERLTPEPTGIGVFEMEDGSGLWEVGGYFTDTPDAAALAVLAAAFEAKPFVVSELPETDWVAKVRRELSPVEAGRFFVYGSHDADKVPEGCEPLLIEAAMAFGTGHHGTTLGCLRALDTLANDGFIGKRVADIGCGTAVLAMGAARIWPDQVYASDIDQVAVDFACGEGNTFRANGSTIHFPGFMRVYREDMDDKKKGDDDEKVLPELKEGDRVPLADILLQQHFTEPPPRFSEASLVKTLEEYGIGRPSTYASIISTLQNREYVEIESRRFFPTDTGRVVSRFLSQHFDTYVDYDFTAQLEDELDAVSRGEKEWVPLLDKFWASFKSRVDDKMENVTREQAVEERSLGTDPKSGKPIVVRLGRYGPMAQIGHRDDEEKPRFAGLRPGQRMNTVTLEEVLKLFELPRKLGETPEGEAISTNIGRFGPYVRYGDKYVSLKEDDDPYTITPERALVVVAEKKQADIDRIIREWKDDAGEIQVQILKGRWGPYITDGNKNAKIPKDKHETAHEYDLETCLKMIEEAPEPRKRGKKKASAKKTAAKADSKKKVTKKKTKKKSKSRAKKKTTAAAKKKASAKQAADGETAKVVTAKS